MNDTRYKLIVFVPISHADAVREAMGEAGAGRFGNYSFCSFSTRGTGRFRPEAGANPAIGEIGKPETVEEERIEVICSEATLDPVITAIKSVHPYDEIAYEVYRLEDR